MTNVKQQMHNMYVGLVFTYWSDDGVKLGTAKQKALQQMQSFAKTIGKNSPVSREISDISAEMSKSISKQIMMDKSSELVVDKAQAPKYKKFGENLVTTSKQALNDMIKRAQKSLQIDTPRKQMQAIEKTSNKQAESMQQNAAPYRALKTNVPSNAPKPLAQHKLDQSTVIRLMWQRQMGKAA